MAGFVSEGEQSPVALLEDVILRDFAPISPSQQSLQFGADEMLSKVQEV